MNWFQYHILFRPQYLLSYNLYKLSRYTHKLAQRVQPFDDDLPF
jgi:hypothetical protein